MNSANEFALEYPDPGYWIDMTGGGAILPGSTLFGAPNSNLLQTSAGMFHFNVGALSSFGGLTYDDEGNPRPGLGPESRKTN